MERAKKAAQQTSTIVNQQVSVADELAKIAKLKEQGDSLRGRIPTDEAEIIEKALAGQRQKVVVVVFFHLHSCLSRGQGDFAVFAKMGMIAVQHQ